ncbi:MAG TPA: arginine--tRNA ligase [Solirubrobacteraceae bacterium]|nr:arginine--tRNA ligase [Solirubrobacteraceae bacterium]
MSPTTTELDALRAALLAAAEDLGEDVHAPTNSALERPPRADFGDYSTNAALLLAPGIGEPPREVAERLGRELSGRLGGDLERFEVAGPGFLNLFLADGWYVRALAGVLAGGERFGARARPQTGSEAVERVLVEFVSANPTGPMHVGHARNAAYGDALARLLAFDGHDVEREFYVNDAGSQVRKLGESIRALARGEEVPADGYRGDYVAGLVAEIATAERVAEMTPDELGAAAVSIMVAQMAASLERFRVRFDSWKYESELHSGIPSPVTRALQLLGERGLTYRSEKAVWLRSTELGDDKDRVLVRASGEHTYFASDVAYHQEKRARGFDRQVDVLGADHHGYVRRMKAAFEALGGDPGTLELITMQLVHLLHRGERAQMSKRAGEFVTLDDLVHEIGVDAARWFLLSRSHDTTIDLDIDLAREQSSENPVYYVQYAHARIASVLDKAGAPRVEAALAELAGAPSADGGVALHSSERALIKRLLAFPHEVQEAAARRAPHRITTYALALAQDFTAFYRDCHVLGAEPASVESLRLALCVATQRTVACALQGLLGVQAPSAM